MLFINPVSFLSLDSIFIFTTFVLKTRPDSESKVHGKDFGSTQFHTLLHHNTGSCFANFEHYFLRGLGLFMQRNRL